MVHDTRALSSDKAWWHVNWPTALMWPPTDERGNWQALGELEARVEGRGGGFTFSASLPERWQARPVSEMSVQLSAAARTLVEKSVVELTENDRIAGNTPLRSLAVGNNKIELVICCPAEVLN